MRRVLVAVTLGLAACSAATAAAAPTWSVRAVPGSESNGDYRAVTFGFARDGLGVIGWSGSGVASPLGVWAAPVRPEGPGAAIEVGQPVAFGQAQVLPLAGGRIAVFQTAGSAAATGHLGGPLTARLGPLPPGEVRVASAVGPRGDLAVLAPRRTPGRAQSRLILAIRAPGGTARGVTVSRRPTPRAYAVAVNGLGDALVAYDVTSHPQGRGPILHTVFARLVRASRRPGPAYRLGSSKGFVTIDLALDDARRAVVGWFGQGCSEGGSCDEGLASAAVARREGQFGLGVRLGSTPPAAGSGRRPGTVHVALGAHGRGHVAWNAADAAGRMGVFAAQVADGRLGRPRLLSPPGTDGWLSDLAGTPDGGAAVVWTAAPAGGAATLMATVRPAGGAFLPAETIGEAPLLDLPTKAAFDPVGARFMAVFRMDVAPGRPVIALATRSGD